MRVVGYLAIALRPRDAFLQRLKEYGYVEGRNVAIELRVEHAIGNRNREARVNA
jgi:hypothetical protein